MILKFGDIKSILRNFTYSEEELLLKLEVILKINTQLREKS